VVPASQRDRVTAGEGSASGRNVEDEPYQCVEAGSDHDDGGHRPSTGSGRRAHNGRLRMQQRWDRRQRPHRIGVQRRLRSQQLRRQRFVGKRLHEHQRRR
jgi:hypothetical protein